MSVGPESGTYEVEYEIVNPTPTGTVSASLKETADWVTDINANSSYGKVMFSVAENTDTVSSRQAVLVLTYEDMSLEFTITQEKETTYGPFSIVIDETGTGDLTWSVYPPDDELTYVSMVTDKESWDSFDSYEEYMLYDLEYFRQGAIDRNLSFEEFLTGSVLKKGTMEGIQVKGLSPDTEYVVYAYGMDVTGRFLTGMYYVETATKPVEQQDVTFELSVEQDFPYVTISAVPSDNEVYYLIDLYNGIGTPEEITEAYQEMMDEVVYMVSAFGMSIYEYMLSVSFQGPGTSEPIMMGGETFTYTAFAVAVDVNTGKLTSVASTLEFEMDLDF